MTIIQTFDPAMCCSTGVCGPSVDPQLTRFAADLDWLKDQGISVERFNLSQEPGKFADDSAVKSALETKGEAGLPVVKVNGELRSSGVYPSRDELAAWAGITRLATKSAALKLAPMTGACCAPTATAAHASNKTDCC